VTDIELARTLENGKIDNAEFKHFHHLRVAWTYLSETDSIKDAITRMSATLRKFAASAGVPEKYHETITAFWMRLLSTLRDADEERSLQDWVTLNPQLLEKNFLFTYYSSKRLFSETARRLWIEPDLRPLPTNANEFCSASPSRDASHRDLSRRVA
jgi:hypothetical protein